MVLIRKPASAMLSNLALVEEAPAIVATIGPKSRFPLVTCGVQPVHVL